MSPCASRHTAEPRGHGGERSPRACRVWGRCRLPPAHLLGKLSSPSLCLLLRSVGSGTEAVLCPAHSRLSMGGEAFVHPPCVLSALSTGDGQGAGLKAARKQAGSVASWAGSTPARRRCARIPADVCARLQASHKTVSGWGWGPGASGHWCPPCAQGRLGGEGQLIVGARKPDAGMQAGWGGRWCGKR